MKRELTTQTFKARPTAEAKNETTTRIAREILDAEAAARAKKTERLRAARLALEATAEEQAPAPPVKAKGRRRA